VTVLLYIIIIVFYRNVFIVTYVLTANGCIVNYPIMVREKNSSSYDHSSILNISIKTLNFGILFI